jgi:hypothetical protein
VFPAFGVQCSLDLSPDLWAHWYLHGFITYACVAGNADPNARNVARIVVNVHRIK